MRRIAEVCVCVTLLVSHGGVPFAAAEKPVEAEPSVPGLPDFLKPRPKLSAEEATKRAKTITLHDVRLDKATPQDVVVKLREELYDRAVARGEKNAELEVGFSSGVALLPDDVKVTLQMKDATVHAVLTEIARQAGLVVSFENGSADLWTKEEVADRAVVLTAKQQQFLKRAESIILPEYSVKDATLPELIKVLNARATVADPQKRGVAIELSPGAAKAETKVTLSLQNVPVTGVIDYVTNLANLRRKVLDSKIVLAAYGEG